MDFDDMARMSLPELRAFVDQVAAKYGLAAQKGAAMDEAEFQQHMERHQQQMEHLRALQANQEALNARLGAMRGLLLPIDAATRHAFLSIALLCKRALETAPHSTLYRMYVLDIARLCKRWLDDQAARGGDAGAEA
jgi:hypothetical protein